MWKLALCEVPLSFSVLDHQSSLSLLAAFASSSRWSGSSSLRTFSVPSYLPTSLACMLSRLSLSLRGFVCLFLLSVWMLFTSMFTCPVPFPGLYGGEEVVWLGSYLVGETWRWSYWIDPLHLCFTEAHTFCHHNCMHYNFLLVPTTSTACPSHLIPLLLLFVRALPIFYPVTRIFGGSFSFFKSSF